MKKSSIAKTAGAKTRVGRLTYAQCSKGARVGKRGALTGFLALILRALESPQSGLVLGVV